MRTTPSFQTCRRTKEITSKSCLLSVAKPHTAPRTGTKAKTLCSKPGCLRSDGRGSRSLLIAPSNWASKTDVTSRRGASSPARPPATPRRTMQCEKAYSHPLPMRQTTERSLSWSATSPTMRDTTVSFCWPGSSTVTPDRLAPTNRRRRMARQR